MGFILGILVMSVVGATRASEVRSFSEIASTATLDQLAALETFARAGLEGAPFCSAEEAKGQAAFPSLIEAEISGRLAREQKSEHLRDFFADDVRRRLCVSRCRCETYLRWLEGANDGPVLEWRRELERMRKRRPITASSVRRCADLNREWICRSAVWRALSREGVKASDSGN